MEKKTSATIIRYLIQIVFFCLAALLIFLAGCSQPVLESEDKELVPEESGEPEKPGELGEPGDPIVIVEDARSDGEHASWTTQYIQGGVWADTWFTNQYERPFSAYEMVYQPYLDILEARLRPAGDWTVFEIETIEPAEGNWVYISLELDTDLDNRPDYLILTRAVEDTSWNDQLITILIDPNGDAGGNRARLAEPFEENWDGFDEVFQSDQAHAYIRLSPDSTSTYQVALSDLILGDMFVWRAWLEGEIYHPGWVEYHDRISLEEAGSPYRYSPNYPLKNLASLDNTCLHFFGGETAQPQPGYCGTWIEVSGEVQLPPDDQYLDPDLEAPVLVILPGGGPDGWDGGTLPPELVFNPGYFFQPTPTPYPHLAELPTMEFVVKNTPDVMIIEVATPEIITSVAETNVAESVPVQTVLVMVPATDLFDPYYGSTQPPTEMFDPYQGSPPTATLKPVIHVPSKTPTRIIILLRTPTPTP